MGSCLLCFITMIVYENTILIFIKYRWGKSRFTAVSTPDTEFILVFLNCCIIFHTNNCKPTLPHRVFTECYKVTGTYMHFLKICDLFLALLLFDIRDLKRSQWVGDDLLYDIEKNLGQDLRRPMDLRLPFALGTSVKNLFLCLVLSFFICIMRRLKYMISEFLLGTEVLWF